jgi:hypothetical protein
MALGRSNSLGGLLRLRVRPDERVVETALDRIEW